VPHWLPDAFIVAVILVAFAIAYRVKDDDPEWLARWQALTPADRSRIAAAARSGSLLASQEEIELAAGYAERDRRRRGPFTLIDAIRIPLGIALIAGGLVADSTIFIVFGVIFIVAGIWAAGGSHRISHAERETIGRNRPF
jgi:hypothetical protein